MLQEKMTLDEFKDIMNFSLGLFQQVVFLQDCTITINKEILLNIDKAIKSSLELRSKKELIEEFISKINAQTDVQNDWKKFVKEQCNIDLQTLIADEHLKSDETKQFVIQSFKVGELKTTGSDIDKLMPPISRFGSENRNMKKQNIIQKLKTFFEKYFGIVITDMINKKDI